MKLLCISNGHGEDVIAVRILSAIAQLDPTIQISALPLSGTGGAYLASGISLVGPVQALPSGGFLNQDPKQLVRDVQKGLLSLTRQQFSAVKTWVADSDQPVNILAVGDIVPLMFARLSKATYHFIGTAKSEYWLRDERGKLPTTGFFGKFKGWSGSVYLPWERSLMSSDRCKSILVRDAFTAQQLQKLGIDAEYAGNPMMDNLAPTHKLKPWLTHLCQPSTAQPLPSSSTQPSAQANSTQANSAQASSAQANRATALYVTSKQHPTQPLSIVLLPGSRQPEAYENWSRILLSIPSLIEHFPNRPLILLGAIAPSLSTTKLSTPLLQANWSKTDWSKTDRSTPAFAQPYPVFTHQNVTLLLVDDAYSDCLHQADLAIATAGTATEQFVGLGKPAITLPGPGPQFTLTFATVQARMLGPSIQIIETPANVGEAIKKIISDPDRLQLIYQNGTHRMGTAGAGKRIAQKILDRMKHAK